MKNTHAFFCGLVVLVIIFLAGSSSAGSLSQFEKIRKSEPNLKQVLTRYYAEEGLSTAELDRIAKKMKTAPLLPTLVAGYDNTFRESQTLSITDNISVSGGTATVGPEDNNYDFLQNSGQVFRVRAAWRLDQLVLHEDALKLVHERQGLAKLRSEMREKISKIYEQRQLYLVSYLQFRLIAPAKADVAYSKYLLLTDSLDALTSGEFHGAWWRRENLTKNFVNKKTLRSTL